MYLCFNGTVFPDHIGWFAKGYKFILETLWTGCLLGVGMTRECLMTLEELKTLITSGEGETLEVKETTGRRVDACETLCAFLNHDDGTLVLWR